MANVYFDVSGVAGIGEWTEAKAEKVANRIESSGCVGFSMAPMPLLPRTRRRRRGRSSRACRCRDPNSTRSSATLLRMHANGEARSRVRRRSTSSVARARPSRVAPRTSAASCPSRRRTAGTPQSDGGVHSCHPRTQGWLPAADGFDDSRPPPRGPLSPARPRRSPLLRGSRAPPRRATARSRLGGYFDVERVILRVEADGRSPKGFFQVDEVLQQLRSPVRGPRTWRPSATARGSSSAACRCAIRTHRVVSRCAAGGASAPPIFFGSCFVGAAGGDEKRDEVVAVFHDATGPAHFYPAVGRDVAQRHGFPGLALVSTSRWHPRSIVSPILRSIEQHA